MISLLNLFCINPTTQPTKLFQNSDGATNSRKRNKNKKEKTVSPKKAKLDPSAEEGATTTGKKKTNRRGKDTNPKTKVCMQYCDLKS